MFKFKKIGILSKNYVTSRIFFTDILTDIIFFVFFRGVGATPKYIFWPDQGHSGKCHSEVSFPILLLSFLFRRIFMTSHMILFAVPLMRY